MIEGHVIFHWSGTDRLKLREYQQGLKGLRYDGRRPDRAELSIAIHSPDPAERANLLTWIDCQVIPALARSSNERGGQDEKILH
jgi:hypothetical protein